METIAKAAVKAHMDDLGIAYSRITVEKSSAGLVVTVHDPARGDDTQWEALSKFWENIGFTVQWTIDPMPAGRMPNITAVNIVTQCSVCDTAIRGNQYWSIRKSCQLHSTNCNDAKFYPIPELAKLS